MWRCMHVFVFTCMMRPEVFLNHFLLYVLIHALSLNLELTRSARLPGGKHQDVFNAEITDPCCQCFSAVDLDFSFVRSGLFYPRGVVHFGIPPNGSGAVFLYARWSDSDDFMDPFLMPQIALQFGFHYSNVVGCEHV